MDPSELTPEKCAGTADSIERILTNLRLNVQPGSDLSQFLLDLRWLSGFADVWSDAAAVDKERAIDAFVCAEQAGHIEYALDSARSIPNLRDKVRNLCRNNLQRRSHAGPGLATLFEIEIASRLARARMEVSFAEPDIVFTNSSSFLNGIACKRPTKLTTVGSNINEATKQIDGHGIPSYIVIGLDGVLLQSIIKVSGQDELKRRGEAELAKVGKSNWSEAASAFTNPLVGGIVLCSRFIAYIEQPSSLGWSFRTYLMPNLGLEGAAAGLRSINELLMGR